MKLEFSRQIFEKYSSIKFHENPSIGSQVVPCGRTDMTKLTVAFSNFANAPKKQITSIKILLSLRGLQNSTKHIDAEFFHVPTAKLNYDAK
jgi:hypothetical protein